MSAPVGAHYVAARAVAAVSRARICGQPAARVRLREWHFAAFAGLP